MPPYRRSDLHKHVTAIMDETGADDPFEAIRAKARAFVRVFTATFGESPPFDVKAMASLRGLHWSDDDPRFSTDSEIAPEENGRVVLRVNSAQPETRQRFSICHEIGHTLFPEYQLAVRCRKTTDRAFADPNDLLETLCDVAASEMMFPTPWFVERIAGMQLSAGAIAELTMEYLGSREATVRRLVELHDAPLAAVFFSWKHKPTEIRAMKRDREVRSLFAEMPIELPEPMLRVDYAILNERFEASYAEHLPKDKSVPSAGPIFEASVSQELRDGLADLDLGTLRGRFAIHALPVFTAEDAMGPENASSVVAILSPQSSGRN